MKDKLPPFPADLDIIKINGRWAQYCGNSIIEDYNSRRHIVGRIRYLENASNGFVEWSNYGILNKCNHCVSTMMEHFGARFTNSEINNIYWGPEEEKHPELKRCVNVFAEYKRIKRTKKRK